MAGFEGKQYRIVVQLKVYAVEILTVNDLGYTNCPRPKLIKATKPSSGFNSYDINSFTINASVLANEVALIKTTQAGTR